MKKYHYKVNIVETHVHEDILQLDPDAELPEGCVMDWDRPNGKVKITSPTKIPGLEEEE